MDLAAEIVCFIFGIFMSVACVNVGVVVDYVEPWFDDILVWCFDMVV